MKQLIYIINIITIAITTLCGWYLLIKGSILGNTVQVLMGLILYTVTLFCAFKQDKYRDDEDIQNFKEKIINKLNKICED